jgi:sterol desaturase/sphingolipid hydroxylase (fatty acid hydroxylase superfamily)
MVHAVGHPDAQRMSEGFGPLIKQPPWLIVIEMLLIGDLLGYWIHRAFHTPLLWRFHAVHHSSTRLDWLSSMRVHPLNEVVSKLAPAVVMASLGFPLKLLAGYVSFLMLYAMLLHANVRWSFGPLRFVVASPLFHRWHHTTEEQGLSKNLAPLFPFIDRCFGTLQLPHNERPAFFGTIGTRVPEGFFAQLLFPFRKC